MRHRTQSIWKLTYRPTTASVTGGYSNLRYEARWLFSKKQKSDFIISVRSRFWLTDFELTRRVLLHALPDLLVTTTLGGSSYNSAYLRHLSQSVTTAQIHALTAFIHLRLLKNVMKAPSSNYSIEWDGNKILNAVQRRRCWRSIFRRYSTIRLEIRHSHEKPRSI